MALQSVAWKFAAQGGTLTLETDSVATPRRKRYRKAGLGNEALHRCLNDIAAILREDYREQFAMGGPGWKPLAPETIRRKTRQGLPKKGKNGRVLPRLRQLGASGADAILIATGSLRDSYGVKNAPGHVEEIDVEAETVTVGSALPYAGYHQTGAILKRKSPPTPSSAKPSGLLRKSRKMIAQSVRLGILPARPVVVSQNAKDKINARVQAYVLEVSEALNE